MVDAAAIRPPRRRTWTRHGAWFAGGLTALMLAFALFGQYLAPHSPYAILGPPFAGPGHGTLLGTDFVGRDVLSRVLYGGRSVVLLAGSATLLGYLVGATLGLVAGYSRGWADPLVMRAMDVLLAFPPILFLLILATGAGPNQEVMVVGVAIVHVPGVARIIRTATLQIRAKGYVEAAVARGERAVAVLWREILPNITGVIVADAGPRFTVSILLVAALNFLGLGIQPPAANWGLMVSENRIGLSSQPWGVAAPALCIATLTVAVNVLADRLGRGRAVADIGEPEP